MKKILTTVLLIATSMTALAQRTTDYLDRGIVAIKSGNGVYVSWRVQSDEYFDVVYNLYRDGVKIAENISTSNYSDNSGSVDSRYSVAAVVRGKEQSPCKDVKPWTTDHLAITPKHDASLKSTYQPNDACCVDVDGDGEVEILMKYNNIQEQNSGFPKAGNNGEYTLFEVLKLDGTVLWWVDCGPNMGDFQNNEQNIVGYDWDQDGKGEVIMRLAEGSTVHMADGTVYKIGADGKNGTSWTNYRTPKGNSGVEWFTYYGKEFLYYANGSTGEPYVLMDYPLKRLESGESDLSSAWGDGYGHRASKFFFGAPYLDGRHPSIFLGRGIYTRHKFVAYDVDPETHQLKQRWRWDNNAKSGPWYGQGYHNYGIADVDMDGRDEIIWGSMVIDDNGLGLSTVGLGHGDAQHHGDFDPYTWGLEGFFCNESAPANNYRDLTTGKILHRYAGGSDDGRAIAGNFCNTVPGAMGFSAHEDAVNCVTHEVSSSLTKNGVGMNFRCYWDGDLQEETFNGGDNTNGNIYKYGNGNPIKVLSAGLTNNSTKATPCFMGDIFGDWREEFIMRTSDNNIVIYSTLTPTKWRNYSLWYDHQYRNGMVWEPCGYNQPPHTSYFLGELEGITEAPVPNTMTGRTEVANGGNIMANEGTVITCETNDMTVSVQEGATPYLYIDNAPSWVQGYAPSNTTMENIPSRIKYEYYTHTLTGAGFSGDMRLVKQGEGTLNLPATEQTYTGSTSIWAGTLNAPASIASSDVWVNRFATFNANGTDIKLKSLKTEYASTVRPGGENAIGTLTATNSFKMGFGSVLELDLYSDGIVADKFNTDTLKIEKKTWTGGPKYNQPVLRIVEHMIEGEKTLAPGRYLIGNAKVISGSLDNILIEGITSLKMHFEKEDNGDIYLVLTGVRSASSIVWKGDNTSVWDYAETQNFYVEGDESKTPDMFVEGDVVNFTDEASTYNVTIPEGVAIPADTIIVNSSKNYTIGGKGIITEGVLVKDGKGTLTMSGTHSYTGGNILRGGITKVTQLACSTAETGNLGGNTTDSKKFLFENGAELQTSGNVTLGSPIRVVGPKGGVINNSGNFIMEGNIYCGDDVTGSEYKSTGNLYKKGAGTFTMSGRSLTVDTLFVQAGTYSNSSATQSKPICVSGSASLNGSKIISTPIVVAKGANASLTTVNRATTSSKLTGTGKITVYCATEKGSNYYATRTPIQFNLKDFEGTIVAEATYTADGHFTFDTSNGSDKWTLNIPASRYVQNSGKTLRVGTVTGSGTLGGTCTFSSAGNSNINTWQVGNSTNFTFAGGVVDNAKFTKMGTGKMTITGKGTWTTTGSVAVNEGELHFNSSSTLGKGVLTVAKDAILSGSTGLTYATSSTTPMTNSSTTVNGTLQVGSTATSTSGYICFGGKNLAFGTTGTLMVGISTCSTGASVPGCTHIYGMKDQPAGTLTFNDGSTIKVYLASTYDPTASIGVDEAKADSFCLFRNFATVKFGNVKYDLPELPNNYYWDTSNVKNGWLYVRYTSVDGIKNVLSSTVVDVEAINASGVTVATFRCTLSEAKARFASMPLPKGIYVLNYRKNKQSCGRITVRK